jgi:hypothetical protein
MILADSVQFQPNAERFRAQDFLSAEDTRVMPARVVATAGKNGSTLSIQIETNSATGQVQIDVDPNNPNSWRSPLHWIDVGVHEIIRSDTNYTNVAAQLLSQRGDQGVQLPMTVPHVKRLTRRRFLLRQAMPASIFPSALLAAQGLSPRAPARQEEPSMKLEKSFPAGASLCVSWDGTLGCLYLGGYRTSFEWTGRNWAHSGSAGEALQILDMKSWAALRNIPLARKLMVADFFGDSGLLYIQTVAERDRGRLMRQQIVVDARTGSLQERLVEDGSAGSGPAGYQPLTGGRLLGTVMDKNTNLLEAIVLAVLPDYVAAERAEVRSADQVRKETSVVVSSDRTRLGYVCNQVLSWRSAENLSVLWARPIASGMMPRFVRISADGRYVAAVLVDTFWVEGQRACFIDVLSTANCALVARVPVNGFQGTAISRLENLWLSASTIRSGHARPMRGRELPFTSWRPAGW